MRLELGKENTLFIHLTLVPFIKTSGELKTKPTQHSVRELRAIGIQPDIILCRTERPLNQNIKAKISLFTNVPLEAVITAQDVENIYEIPLLYAREELDTIILKYLNLDKKKRKLSRWTDLVNRMNNPEDEVNIALVGKYAGLQDSYISLKEALIHGGIKNRLKVNISWIEAEDLEKGKLEDILGQHDGILVPGGFGVRGIEGKIKAVSYAREKKIPYFGICLGMQCATIEFARKIANLSRANSTEFDSKTPHKIFFKWRELKGIDKMGGTMRLGSYSCRLQKNSFAYKSYGNEAISERHRHRYEFNPEYEKTLGQAGLFFSGKNPDYGLVEIIEIKNHPWFLGCQFHPEFKSRPLEPHPLFKSFIGASYAFRLKRNKNNSKD
jgi:CTP synthase